MANKTVIEGSDRVKATQLKEFFNQIASGHITGIYLQHFLEKDYLPFELALDYYLKKKLESKVLETLVVARGIILAHDDYGKYRSDNYGEYDIYYDPNLWDSEPGVFFRPLYKNLSVIEPASSIPRNEGFTPAYEYAKKALRLKLHWFDPTPKPKQFGE